MLAAAVAVVPRLPMVGLPFVVAWLPLPLVLEELLVPVLATATP